MSQVTIAKYAYRGMDVEISSGVFQPNRTTELLLDAVLGEDLSGKSVLDLGCGSGVVGLAVRSFSKARDVAGSDISVKAVECAKANARRLGLEIDHREGSMFDPWAGRMFDVIADDVSGVAEPIARITPWYPPEIVCDAGLDGTINSIRMLEAARSHLKPGGVIFLPTVSLSNEAKILEVARKLYHQVQLLLKKSWPFREDIWQKVAANGACKRLIEEGIIKVVPRGSRMLWDTSVYKVCLNP
ncbi:MAG: class I SAM-dependent methyltransferase [Candidatus Coatesbacteria bacterium]